MFALILQWIIPATLRQLKNKWRLTYLCVFRALIYSNLLFSYLRNGPDKNDSNNGNEHVGMQKGANFSIVCTYFWLA